MAHYNFLRDFEEGKAAEAFVSKWLINYEMGGNSELLSREEQGRGDLLVHPEGKDDYTIEVKFDKMAEKTGNLCFEVNNAKGQPTGIAATKADYVIYLVPKGSSMTIYKFATESLREYIFKNTKLRYVNGGDRNSYGLILVPIELVLKDSLACFIEEIEDAKL